MNEEKRSEPMKPLTYPRWPTAWQVISGCTALAAVYIAAWQMNYTREALIGSTRAWVNVSVDEASVSLTWDGYVPSITAAVTSTNIGNSPALDALAYPVIIPPDEPVPSGSILDYVNLHCSGWKKPQGNLLFPRDPKTETTRSEFTDPGFIAAVRDLHGNIRQPISIPYAMSVIVCGRYRILGDDQVHYTARLYTLTDDQGAAPVVGTNLAAGKARLTRQLRGDYAD